MEANRLDPNSLTPQTELLELLKEKCPEVFTEGKVDAEKLRQSLGDEVETGRERYGLSWAGKSDCFRHIQEPTTATLVPVKEESVDFDKTQNIFIEGDNLGVLKILQKSYYGQIKMIYIDPPYNTGNDSFIYPDRFQETQEEYLQRIGDKDVEGNLIRDGFFRKNSKESGHFHSNWLSMMYPRLFLARNLLRSDGVILCSIDDGECSNLKNIMNEVFGEENFMAQIVWKSRQIVDSRAQNGVSNDHEYILVYSKSGETSLRGRAIDKSKYSNPDNDPRGDWMSNSILGLATKSQRPNLHYQIADPKTGCTYECPPATGWRYSKKTMRQKINDNRIVFPAKSQGRPREKKFLFELESKFTNFSSVLDTVIGFTLHGTREVRSLLGDNYYPFPKPVSLLKTMVEQGTTEGHDIILDFFAGSCTTAHAVMALNTEDGGNRKYICVQLAEPCDADSEAYKAGFETIADIGKERIRRAAKKIAKDNEGKLNFDKTKLDLGFKVFRLSESNFKVWRSDVKTGRELEKQMGLFVDNVQPEAKQENILYELILKSGLDLNVSVEARRANGKQHFSVDEGRLIICLEDKITQKFIDAIIKAKPEKVICLDKAFSGNDQLKTNTSLQMKAEKIDFKVI